jgi:signal transduction histidine kinase
VRGWLFILSRGQRGPSAMLGFDALRPGPIACTAELSLLLMACDAVANAVARESLERDRERLEANLQHARRMETLGALTSGIAHNFNNIIGAISGYACGGAGPRPGRPDPHFRPRRGAPLDAGVSQIFGFRSEVAARCLAQL